MLRQPTPVPAAIRLEQLRSVYANIPVSFISGAIANIMLAAVFAGTAPWPWLVLWTLCSWVPVVVLLRLGKAFEALPQPLAQVQRYSRYLTATLTVHGAIRGVLPWIAFESASPLVIALLMCYMAAMEAGSMAVVAPVLPAFVGYVLPFNVSIGLCLATLDEPVYWALALGCVFFTVGILGSASKTSATFQRMLELRFENEALVARLREESQQAHAAKLDAEQARQEAETANRDKSRFLAAASHDLRQPIHALGLFLETLGRSDLTPRQHDVLEHANAACLASGEMLNTLLDFSRLEAGVVAVKRQPFRLLPLLLRIEAELAPLADAKGIVYRVHERELVVDSDPALVGLVLRNLISNAIRYTERGGVLIGCRQRGHSVQLQVWDTGIGIAEHDLPSVFHEFLQLDNPERDRRKGLGLGLAIVQRLADTLGHPLQVRSVPGRGSMFGLTLPLSSELPHATGSALMLAPPQLDALHLNILVVDDDESVRAAMHHLLESWGAHCLLASSAEHAFEVARHQLAQSTGLDVVICDYRLPGAHTGNEVIAGLRTLHPRLKAILVTGDTAPDRLREAQSGGVPLLHKPVRPADLYRCIVEAGFCSAEDQK